MGKGSLISFEGIDGSGKTDQLFNLAKELYSRDKSVNVFLTREPTDSAWGRKIRGILKSDADALGKARECLDLFVADRREHVEKAIKPALASGATVICDRYLHSTYAFQQAQGIPFGEIRKAQSGIMQPDAVFLLDVPAEIAFGRIRRRGTGGNEKFEQLGFMKRLRECYLQLPRQLPQDNITVIDGTGTREEVFARILRECGRMRVL